ncbi:fibronectin type III domain-containing protein 11-like [Hypomesus transpacificus]|uniref:fibronectin type III domain-containing protein 11-like n=1 Tax=Hypomesus transpacificus TaxID=137520 RepID=UPI001F071F4E|nr:fibronectin type III domain-containing protein 11-like [Hypomesus transpacificus]
MKRMKVTTLNTDNSEQCHPMKTQHSGDADNQTGNNPNTQKATDDTWSAFMDLRYHILQLLSTKLTPCTLGDCKARLEVLRKCSYYMDVHQDLSMADQQQQNALSDSTILHLIDPWKFQRMKKLANSQVKIQLSLLEELYEQICRGRADLEAIANQCGPTTFGQDNAPLRKRVEQLTTALVDFDSTLSPGRLHAKHRLISETGNTKVPQLWLTLNVKMPVMFDKLRSEALASFTRLHWYIAGTDQQDPGEQFEIHHKLIQPTNADEGNQTGMVTCSGNHIQINNLLPERCYEFTVKRADTCYLVYGFWNETIILRTAPVSPGGQMGCREKKRRLCLW